MKNERLDLEEYVDYAWHQINRGQVLVLLLSIVFADISSFVMRNWKWLLAAAAFLFDYGTVVAHSGPHFVSYFVSLVTGITGATWTWLICSEFEREDKMM